MAKTFEQEFKTLLEVAENCFGTSNAWLLFEKRLRIYIRIGPRRLHDGEIYDCVQLANMGTIGTNGNPPKKRGRFRRMCATIRTMTDKPFFIENVLEEGLAEAFVRQGFVVISKDGGMTCLGRFD